MTLESTVVGSRTVRLETALALAGQGIPLGVHPGDRVMAAAECAVEAAADLVAGRFVRASVQVAAHRPGAIELGRGTLEGDGISQALAGARVVVATVCTIGPLLERHVSALLPTDPLAALAFDGLGSAACERLAGELCAEIEEQAAAERLQVTGRLSPGMIGWPLLEGQRQLFALVDPAPIGVALTAVGQMIPRKSLSFVVGVGAHVQRQAACAACGLKDRCRFRRNDG